MAAAGGPDLDRPFGSIDAEMYEDEESTRAVPRDEFARGQDAQVIVGSDAVGDDATLAVLPGENSANNPQIAALARTMMAQEEGAGFGPGPGALAHGARPNPHAAWTPAGGPMQMGQANSHQQPGSNPHMQQPGSNPHMQQPGSNPHMQQPGSNPHMQQPGSNPRMQEPGSNPRMQEPGSNPHMQGVPQNMGGPHRGHGMPGQMGMPMQAMQGQYPGQPGAPMMRGQGPGPGGQMHLEQPPPGRSRVRLSGQIILLSVVGVICLAIFITGIILFATTKF